MPGIATPETRPDLEQDEKTKPDISLEPGYLVICWDDPVNLMDYVICFLKPDDSPGCRVVFVQVIQELDGRVAVTAEGKASVKDHKRR